MKFNLMNRIIKLFKKHLSLALVMAGLLYLNSSNAQSCSCLPQQVMTKIYKAYDSINYLTFNIKYSYSSDTINGDFIDDVLEGSYTLAGKRARFNLGDIEFMQNDSFFISVYKDNKLMVVADPRNANTGSELPMRQVMDSLISTAAHYTITNTVVAGDTVALVYNKLDSLAEFLQFKVTYDTTDNIIQSIRYVFEETAETDSLGYTSLPVLRKKTLLIEFSDYRFDNVADSLYDENQFIYFEDRVCKPVDKYDDFKIYYSRRPDSVR